VINLRYHIVSIVAVFLALGIGLALGSTFVDGFIVGELERNVNLLQESRDELRDDLISAEDQLAAERAQRANEQVAAIPLLGGGRLSDTPVMIIAAEGIEDGAFQTIRAALLGSAAQYEGTLWLTGGLNLSDEENRIEVADALDLVDDNETLVRRALQIRLGRVLFPDPPESEGEVLGGTATDVASELLDAGGSGLRASAPTRSRPVVNVLTQLRDAALVRYDNEFAVTGALDAVPVFGTRFLLISNADSELDPREIFIPLFNTVVSDDIDVVMVGLEPSPSDPEANPVSFVGIIRNDVEYSRIIATVDNAASFNGTLATLILVDTDVVDHLGSGPGARSELPTP